MLTLPKIIELPPQPYLAMRRLVQIPFGPVIDATMPKLFKWIGDHRVEPSGPPFFKYNVIDMAKELEIEFGVPTATVLPADADVVTGTIPAGRYATLTYHGHYDNLVEVTSVLIGWAGCTRSISIWRKRPRATSLRRGSKSIPTIRGR